MKILIVIQPSLQVITQFIHLATQRTFDLQYRIRKLTDYHFQEIQVQNIKQNYIISKTTSPSHHNEGNISKESTLSSIFIINIIVLRGQLTDEKKIILIDKGLCFTFLFTVH